MKKLTIEQKCILTLLSLDGVINEQLSKSGTKIKYWVRGKRTNVKLPKSIKARVAPNSKITGTFWEYAVVLKVEQDKNVL